jgi:hypothetical protein
MGLLEGINLRFNQTKSALKPSYSLRRHKAVHWCLMAWSRRRKWFVLVLGLVALAAIWLWPVSPLRNAYNQIREGMRDRQVGEVVERCGCSKYFKNPGLHQLDMLTYQGADGETLTIRFNLEGQRSGMGATHFTDGHVVGKEYHSAFEAKLRGLWELLRECFTG